MTFQKTVPVKWADLCQHVDAAMRTAFRLKQNRWVYVLPDGRIWIANGAESVPADAVLSIYVEWGFGPAVSFDLADPQPNLALSSAPPSAEEIDSSADDDD